MKIHILNKYIIKIQLIIRQIIEGEKDEEKNTEKQNKYVAIANAAENIY